MGRIFRKWKATRARRTRLAGLFAKSAETLFWLIIVGPFVAPRPMPFLIWCACALGYFLAAAGSYWYTIKMDGRSE